MVDSTYPFARLCLADSQGFYGAPPKNYLLNWARILPHLHQEHIYGGITLRKNWPLPNTTETGIAYCPTHISQTIFYYQIGSLLLAILLDFFNRSTRRQRFSY